MVQIQPIKNKPQEDKSELLNSTVSSEVKLKNDSKCSACCMFVSACLFIMYLTIVILMSWFLRGYIYAHLKHFLRIDNIYDITLQTSQHNENNIIPLGITEQLSKSRPYPLDISLTSPGHIPNEKKVSDLKDEEMDHRNLEQNLLDNLENDLGFMDSPQIMGTDTLSDIISNMSDYILNELEMVEESLKSEVEKIGDGTIKPDDIDLFADDIISNISHILEEEIKIVEDSIKSNSPTNNYHSREKSTESGEGFMGFLGKIFGHANIRLGSVENSEKLENRANEEYKYNSFTPRLSPEHRFNLPDPEPEPYPDHNYLESSENIILNKAVTSIRNLFNKNKDASPDVVKVLLRPEEQHIRFKVMLLEYLEIFGIVLAAMSLLTFVLFLTITRVIGFIDQRQVIKRHKLEESMIINEKGPHVI